MKKLITIVFAALMLVSLGGFSQGFTMKGTIDGVKDGKVTLAKRGGEKFTTGLDKGSFILKGKIAEPGYFTLSVEGIRGGLGVFLQNTDFTVKAKKVNNGRADVLEAEEIKGGKAQEVWQNYQDMSAKMGEVFQAETAEFMEAYRAKDEEKIKKLEPVYDAAYEKMQEGTFKFIADNSGCIVAAYLLQGQASRIDDPEKLNGMITKLDPWMANTSYVKGLNETLAVKRKTAVGVMAPDFTQNDPDGKPVSLSDFRGQYVLIDFWASWCGPCRQENPNVVEAYNKFKNKGFTVLGVSLDRENGKEDWLKAIKDDNLTWTHVSDLKFWDNVVAKDYGVRSIPANLLIGKDGKILAKNLRGEDLHTQLKTFVK